MSKPAVASKNVNQRPKRSHSNTLQKTLDSCAPFALASHENGVAQLVPASLELPVGDSCRKFDRVLVHGDGLVAVQDIVRYGVQVYLKNKMKESRRAHRSQILGSKNKSTHSELEGDETGSLGNRAASECGSKEVLARGFHKI